MPFFISVLVALISQASPEEPKLSCFDKERLKRLADGSVLYRENGFDFWFPSLAAAENEIGVQNEIKKLISSRIKAATEIRFACEVEASKVLYLKSGASGDFVLEKAKEDERYIKCEVRLLEEKSGLKIEVSQQGVHVKEQSMPDLALEDFLASSIKFLALSPELQVSGGRVQVTTNYLLDGDDLRISVLKTVYAPTKTYRFEDRIRLNLGSSPYFVENERFFEGEAYERFRAGSSMPDFSKPKK